MHGRITNGAKSGGGHRARLRKRLFDGGGKALLDHELVEYLLALAIPRRDTKDQAKALIARYGGIGPLLSASAETLPRTRPWSTCRLRACNCWPKAWVMRSKMTASTTMPAIQASRFEGILAGSSIAL